MDVHRKEARKAKQVEEEGAKLLLGLQNRENRGEKGTSPSKGRGASLGTICEMRRVVRGDDG